MHEFVHALEHAWADSLKMLPFLLLAFAVLETLETRLEEKTAAAVQKAGKAGPLAGALLGLLPQCGFSVIGSNFYARRIITLGTLLAIYLSTSDEALLILLTNPGHLPDLFLVLGLKLLIAVVAGYAIDLFHHRKHEHEECHHVHHHDDSCEDEELVGESHCCIHTDWKAVALCVVKRTASVWFFLFAANFLLTYVIELVGEDQLQAAMLGDSIFQPLLTALIGLIPNCAPSVILAELYVEGAISLASVIAGLCTGAGVGLIVLFRVNRGVKSNLAVAGLLYAIGAAAGIVIQLAQSLR